MVLLSGAFVTFSCLSHSILSDRNNFDDAVSVVCTVTVAVAVILEQEEQQQFGKKPPKQKKTKDRSREVERSRELVTNDRSPWPVIKLRRTKCCTHVPWPTDIMWPYHADLYVQYNVLIAAHHLQKDTLHNPLFLIPTFSCVSHAPPIRAFESLDCFVRKKKKKFASSINIVIQGCDKKKNTCKNGK